jgi:hypothetical protein
MRVDPKLPQKLPVMQKEDLIFPRITVCSLDRHSAGKLLAAVEKGDTLRGLVAAVERFAHRDVCDTVALRRQVADAAIEQVGYPLG